MALRLTDPLGRPRRLPEVFGGKRCATGGCPRPLGVAGFSVLVIRALHIDREGSARGCLASFRYASATPARRWRSTSAASSAAPRSEERRVGQECVSPCRSRGSPTH